MKVDKNTVIFSISRKENPKCLIKSLMFIFGVIVEEIQFFLSSLQVKIKSQQLEKYEI